MLLISKTSALGQTKLYPNRFLEEDVRFELTVPFETSVFKTDALGRSANLPLTYTFLASRQRLELRPRVLETHVLPLHQRDILGGRGDT